MRYIEKEITGYATGYNSSGSYSSSYPWSNITKAFDWDSNVSPTLTSTSYWRGTYASIKIYQYGNDVMQGYNFLKGIKNYKCCLNEDFEDAYDGTGTEYLNFSCIPSDSEITQFKFKVRSSIGKYHNEAVRYFKSSKDVTTNGSNSEGNFAAYKTASSSGIAVTENMNYNNANTDGHVFTKNSSGNFVYSHMNYHIGQWTISDFKNGYFLPQVFWGASSSSAGTGYCYPRGFSVTLAVKIPVYTISTSVSGQGTVIGGGEYVSERVATLIATPSSGYVFKQWSDGNTSQTRTVVSSRDITYTAIFEPNSYITYDSHLNFQKWKNNGINASNGTISNITNTGFSLISNDGVNEATATSPIFPVNAGESYKIDIDITGNDWDVYIFFYDANTTSGTGIDFIDGPTRRFSDNFNQGASFTAPTGAVQAAIRVDANGSSNTVNFDNFRIYPDSYSYMSSSVPASSRSNMGAWSIPTPTRTNYVFKGWNTKPDGNGTYYTSSSTYPTNDLILYSIWKCIISTNTDPIGSGITSGDGVYDLGDSITLTATPNAGYQFVKWSDGSTSQSRPLIVNTSKNYTALFKLNPSFLGDLVTKYVFFGSSPLQIFFNGEKII